MVDGFHIHTSYRRMNPLAIPLSGVWRGLGRDGGGDITNIQCRVIQNCLNESLLYNKYIIIKMGTT
jgi:hypothetical protein